MPMLAQGNYWESMGFQSVACLNPVIGATEHVILTRPTTQPSAILMEVTVVKPHATLLPFTAVVQAKKARDLDRLVTSASIQTWMSTLILNCAISQTVRGSEMGGAIQALRCTTRKLVIGMEVIAVRKHATKASLILHAGILSTLTIAKTLPGSPQTGLLAAQ